MNIIVFGSGSGTNLKAIIEAQIKIKAIFSDRKCPFLEIGEKAEIPSLHLSFISFFKSLGVDNHKDPEARRRYDQEVVNKIESYKPDLIVLAGYMRLITTPLIEAFKDKIINVHPADLAKVDHNGKRVYVGADSVTLALMNGETKTRSTVFMVDENIDTGPILNFGPWVPYTEGHPINQEQVKKHQEKQKKLSDHPALIQAIEKFSKKNSCNFLS